MALRALIGTRNDGAFGFGIAKPGASVVAGQSPQAMIVSSFDGVDLPQILMLRSALVGTGSTFLPFGEDVGFYPLTVMRIGYSTGSAYQPVVSPLSGIGYSTIYATIGTTGVTVANGTAGLIHAVVMSLKVPLF